ncbi:hypothetical protein [Pseudorhizobium pelagicum]|uniref:Uncharacterized protein n=1 Tax=Pseudorhizobium pelagicum TaxID=1509405 RepID=A0A922P258_9HYPH|nr:hypothetical protein [Pseudorhizobium pelagicum]KEQ07024.1 hypothetical protein GV67_22575 [Pseudorhizobium pelagicum]KEQ09969.1 hypothetical protein GV68_18365 [Pseudorhizobium pelagicum]
MFDFNPEAFDAWQADYDEFNYAFRNYCFLQFRAYSIHADFVPNVTRQIHAMWIESCQRWLNKETDAHTRKLSYLKRASLLLHALVSLQFIGNVGEHEYNEEEKVIFRGPPEAYASSRQDLIDAREIVLALDFVLNIIHYFELNRIDRAEEFRPRLTVDMRHDLIGYLLSGRAEEKAIYLILKALYLRHSSGGSAN